VSKSGKTRLFNKVAKMLSIAKDDVRRQTWELGESDKAFDNEFRSEIKKRTHQVAEEGPQISSQSTPTRPCFHPPSEPWGPRATTIRYTSSQTTFLLKPSHQLNTPCRKEKSSIKILSANRPCAFGASPATPFFLSKRDVLCQTNLLRRN